MMKKSIKKAAILASTALVSLAIMGGTALASANNVASYEKLKQAAIDSMFKGNNYTTRIDAQFYFDGEEMGAFQNSTELESYGRSSNTTLVRMGGEEQKMEYYSYDGDHYNFNPLDGTYSHYSFPYTVPSYERYQPTSTERNFMGAMIDLLSGDMKNYFTQSQDGEISVNLTKSQIPEIVQLGLDVMMEQMQKETENRVSQDNAYGNSLHGSWEDLFFSRITELEDITADSANLTATLGDDGSVKNVVFTAIATGVDKNGDMHEFKLDMSGEITDYGTTVVEPFDTNGKEIIEMEQDSVFEIRTGDKVIKTDMYTGEVISTTNAEDTETSGEAN